MADSSDSLQQQAVRSQEEGEEELEARRDETGPLHHPAAPVDELFDVSTTVDPSYVISLIRKLLPPIDGRSGNPPQSTDDSNYTSRRPKFDQMEDDTTTVSGNGIEQLPDSYGMQTIDMQANSNGFGSLKSAAYSGDQCLKTDNHSQSAREETWEENGTILWDLAANQSHAELMVENLLLDVLLANLMTPSSVRVIEICIGIIGNLACHEVIMNRIISKQGLVEIVVDQLFSDDTPCLNEIFRLLTLGVQSSEQITWAKAMQSEPVLSRIHWITENTLNPQLIEKSLGLLLAILENERDVASVLLPALVKLGLPNLLSNLLAFEMGKLTTERAPDRYPALDSVLRAIEALSVNDDYATEISSRKEILQMTTELVKLPDKIEIGHCCVTAAVVIANILTDSADSAAELSKDLLFLQGLFDLFPFTSDDPEARDALWSLLSRLLIEIVETEMNSSSLSSLVLLLVAKSEEIEDDLLDYCSGSSSQGNDDPKSQVRMKFRNSALKKIAGILKQWTLVKESKDQESSLGENHVDYEDVIKLLDCCLKHTR